MFSPMLYQNSKTSHHSMTRSNCIIILIIVLLAKKSSWDWRPPSATLVWSTDVLRIMVYKMQKCATVASRNVTPVPLITSQGIKYVTVIFHWEKEIHLTSCVVSDAVSNWHWLSKDVLFIYEFRWSFLSCWDIFSLRSLPRLIYMCSRKSQWEGLSICIDECISPWGSELLFKNANQSLMRNQRRVTEEQEALQRWKSFAGTWARTPRWDLHTSKSTFTPSLNYFIL